MQDLWQIIQTSNFVELPTLETSSPPTILYLYRDNAMKIEREMPIFEWNYDFTLVLTKELGYMQWPMIMNYLCHIRRYPTSN